MAAVMAVFAGFINIFKGLEGILSSLGKIGCSIPGGLQPRIALMKKVREDLGEPNREGCFNNSSRDRIFGASKEVGAILAVLELVEREHYRMALPALKDRCEALLSTDELLNERVRTLKYKVKISAKHKVRELPLHAMRARFTEHLDELKKLELEQADETIRRVLAEISRPAEKTTRKGSRSADKRQMDRNRRNAMKGNRASKNRQAA